MNKLKKLLSLLKPKKGAMGTFNQVIVGIIVLIILFVLAYKITDVVKGTQTVNSIGYNATVELEGTNGLGLAKSLVPVAIIMLIFAALFGLFALFRVMR